MPAGLVVPVSGPYVATWNALALGTQNDDGFTLQGSYQAQEINASDAYGMTLVEAIWRGLNWRIRFRGLEWNKRGLLSATQVFGSVDNDETTLTPTLDSIGDRFSKFAQALLLTAILGNPPTIPQTLTANNAIIAPNSNVEWMMTSKMREAPLEMVLLPYHDDSSDEDISFTTT